MHTTLSQIVSFVTFSLFLATRQICLNCSIAEACLERHCQQAYVPIVVVFSSVVETREVAFIFEQFVQNSLIPEGTEHGILIQRDELAENTPTNAWVDLLFVKDY